MAEVLRPDDVVAPSLTRPEVKPPQRVAEMMVPVPMVELFTIAARQGAYPIVPRETTFHIVLVRPALGTGEATIGTPDQTIAIGVDRPVTLSV